MNQTRLRSQQRQRAEPPKAHEKPVAQLQDVKRWCAQLIVVHSEVDEVRSRIVRASTLNGQARLDEQTSCIEGLRLVLSVLELAIGELDQRKDSAATVDGKRIS